MVTLRLMFYASEPLFHASAESLMAGILPIGSCYRDAQQGEQPETASRSRIVILIISHPLAF